MFQISATLDGKADLYPGHFVLAHDMSYGAAIEALSTAPLKKDDDRDDPRGLRRPPAAPWSPKTASVAAT